jgi:PIN domain nuclease of toxin-antitoxin system
VRLLLDSHALIWFVAGSDQLSPRARRSIGEVAERSYVSAASAWEITTKHRLGKLPAADQLAPDFEDLTLRLGFSPLPITMAHAALAGRLIGQNKDPFDRLLIAQSILDGLTLVSNETSFDAFGVQRLW